MNAKWFVPVVVLAALGCGTPPDQQKPPETCGNTIDDDGNGLVDCADPVCASDASCQAPSECSKQTDCFRATYDYFDYSSEPIPRCDAKPTSTNPSFHKCVTEGQSIDMFIQLKKQWAAPSYETPGATVRLIKKTAVDGSAVNCDLINSLAIGNAPTDADILDRSNKFNYLAFEAQSVNSTNGAVTIRLLSNVTTGSDFLVFAELWTGKISSSTHYPTGKRVEWQCYDNATQYAALLAPIVPADDWPSGMPTATSRTMDIPMPGPQNP